jgi:hypothetical protein
MKHAMPQTNRSIDPVPHAVRPSMSAGIDHPVKNNRVNRQAVDVVDASDAAHEAACSFGWTLTIAELKRSGIENRPNSTLASQSGAGGSKTLRTLGTGVLAFLGRRDTYQAFGMQFSHESQKVALKCVWGNIIFLMNLFEHSAQWPTFLEERPDPCPQLLEAEVRPGFQVQNHDLTIEVACHEVVANRHD